MIEKVVERIDELDQPHLKLLVMHDFMWALVEEWASSKAHTHQISSQDSNHNVRVVEAEAHKHVSGPYQLSPTTWLTPRCASM